MTTRDLRPMSVGEVLDRSFQVLRGHLAPLFVTALLGTAPLLLVYLAMGVPYGAAVPESQLAAMTGMMMVMLIVFVFAVSVSWAALTRQVDQAVVGGAVSLGDGLRHGVRAFFRMLAVGILIYLVGAGLLIPVGMVVALAAGVGSALLGGGIAWMAVVVLAVVAAAVAALLLWAPMAFMAIPALISEELGPIEALNRAHKLGKGGRLRVVGTSLVAWIVMMLPTIGLPFLLGFGLALWTPAGAGTVSTTQVYLYQAMTFVIGGLTTPFMVAAMVFTYYDRRVRREGYDVELVSESIPQHV